MALHKILWMRLRGYRRYKMLSPSGRLSSGWYKRVKFDFRFPYRTGVGISDEGIEIDFYGYTPPKERNG